jgi:beta-lactamase class A
MLTRRACLFALGAGISAARQKSSLLDEWRQIARTTDGTVGAAALHLTTGQSVSLNGDESFPLASVCKLPIAMNMLALVDERKFDLKQEIEVLPQHVVSGVSNIAPRWPAQRRFPLDEMIELMVARSDNTAVETLFRIGGDRPAMAARFREWRIGGFAWIEASANAGSIAAESTLSLRRINGRMRSLPRCSPKRHRRRNIGQPCAIWPTRATPVLRTERFSCSRVLFAVSFFRSLQRRVSSRF